MLSLAAKKCTDFLLSHDKIRGEQTAIYVYGFELLFSTVSCIGVLLLLAAVLNYFILAVTFLAYFVPIRITAGGYHAKSYERCFFLTNGVAFFCVMTAIFIQKWRGLFLYGFLGAILAAAVWIIWKEAPIIPARYRDRTDKYERNRRYAHGVLIAEMAGLLIMAVLKNSCMASTAVITSCAVAVMMILAKKEGK